MAGARGAARGGDWPGVRIGGFPIGRVPRRVETDPHWCILENALPAALVRVKCPTALETVRCLKALKCSCERFEYALCRWHSARVARFWFHLILQLITASSFFFLALFGLYIVNQSGRCFPSALGGFVCLFVWSLRKASGSSSAGAGAGDIARLRAEELESA